MPSAPYRNLLRTPGAAAFFLTACTGRVGIAMTGLGIVWLVHGHTGSYASAGLVTGGFAVAEALAGPQLARLTDRFGQTRVLPPLLLAHAVATAALLATVAGGAPSALMTAGGVLAGATIPQLGALSAARWVTLLRAERPAELPSAFALESLGNAVGYLAGPALVSVLGASGHPALGTALAAALVVGGGGALATQHRTAPPPSAPKATGGACGRGSRAWGFRAWGCRAWGFRGGGFRVGRSRAWDPLAGRSRDGDSLAGGFRAGCSRAWASLAWGSRVGRSRAWASLAWDPLAGRSRAWGPLAGRSRDVASRARASRAGRSLLRPGFAVLVALNLAIGVYFGAVQVSVTAFAVEHHAPAAAAPVFVASNCGGLLAGWLYGLRRWRTAPRAQLAVASAGLALGSLLLLTARSPLSLGTLAVLTGAAVPPVLVLLSVLAESAVHRSVLTEAFSWLNSASAAGSAAAAAVSGRAVDAFGVHGGFAVAAAATTGMAAVAAAGLRAPRTPGRVPPAQGTASPGGAVDERG